MQTPQEKLKQLKGKYEAVFSTPDGAIVLKDILESAGLFRASFTELDGGKQELGFNIQYMATPQPEQPKEQVNAIV